MWDLGLECCTNATTEKADMAVSAEIKERVAVDGGLYYLDEVARILAVTDLEVRGSGSGLGVRRLGGLQRRGFFLLGINEYEGRRRYMSFGAVVTSRAVSLLLSFGVSTDRIGMAHDYLKEETGLEYPFAWRRFWMESPTASRHVYTKLNQLIVVASATGQLTFTDLLHGEVTRDWSMDFDGSVDELAASWSPASGVVIDPFVQSGAPCVEGTRTPTSSLYGCVEAGDSVENVADWFNLSETQVKDAIAWESRLACVGDVG